MIKIEEILSNTDKYDIIEPFSFKYATPCFKKKIINKNYKYQGLFTLEFNIDLVSYSIATKDIKYSHYVTKYSITIIDYLKILEKIFNNNSNICFHCKQKNELNYCCNLCHEWFCDSCTKIHLKNVDLDLENLKKYFTFGFEFKEYLNMKFFTLNDIQKNWRICECRKGGGEIVSYCRHGLKCNNCICQKCKNQNKEYYSYNYRFFHLDLIFLETELKNYKIELSDKINKLIEEFNDKIVRVFEEGLKKIENESRKKRLKRNFYKVRNKFISYLKLEIIVFNILEKNRNYSLIQLFKKQKYFDMIIKYKYNNKINEDKNFSIFSNSLTTNILYFYKKNEDKLEKSSLKKKYRYKEINNDDEKTNSQENKCLPDTYLDLDYEDLEEFKKNVNNTNLFNFLLLKYEDDEEDNNENEDNENKDFVYSIELTGENNSIETKQELFFNEEGYLIGCEPLLKLENGKWFFKIINNNDNFILILNESLSLKNAFKVEQTIYCGDLFKIHILEKQKKLIIHFQIRYEFDSLYSGDDNEIAILDLFPPYNIDFIKIQGVDVDNVFLLKNNKNKVLIPCTKPFLSFMILDYELKQIETIFELVNPIIPKELKFSYVFIPYISDIKELKNGKLLLIGKQKYDGYYPRPNKEYSFTIVYDLNNFCIEEAENEISYGEWACDEIYLF